MPDAETADGLMDLQGFGNATDEPFLSLMRWRRRELNPKGEILLTT